MQTAHDFKAVTIDGKTRTLRSYAGKTLLIVNVASRCQFTPQYEGLEALYREHADAGFEILGFPCDQFGNQEPGSESEIQSFCSLTYDITFPMFAKVAVNGPQAHPLFAYLKHGAPGLLGAEEVKWNFTKFLVDGGGRVLRRYAPAYTPAFIARDLEGLLPSKARA
jgi:glutathione peroxidase